ncbi:MAG: aldo/keto reductase [Balneolaceae bacterium]|nr:aldo/keto reductase [Balneolaceae bacterium]MBO6547504.1 aldo/keto reductase [Balneolaceae bacterium]MBO6647549.1 aldo/keto reductase [Balneolaceae bacterium]
MKFNFLGKSELSVSEVSFGCMSLGTDHTQNERLLRQAFESGIIFFDTADLYDKGLNEESAGKALAPIRDQVIITTKVGNQWRPDGSGWDWNPTKEYILQAVEDSLRRLQTETIDLYQLHGGTVEDPIDEIIGAFELLKEQGKIREYGISSIRPNVIREWVKHSNMVSVMMQYSLLDRRPEESCLDVLNEKSISVITRGSLAKGLLIDKPAREYLGYPSSDVEKLRKAINKTGEPIASSLGYVLQHPAVASAVVGIRTKKQLDGVISSLKHSVSEEEFSELASILKPKVYEKHR